MSRKPPSITVVVHVAETKGVDVDDLDPLYEYIDPDALDDLFSHGFDGEMTFHYEDCEVSISGDGEIEVANGHAIR